MRGHKAIGRVALLAIPLLFWLTQPRAALAHPMGNFSINHYAGIRVEAGSIEVRYLIDMAEIPTYQEIQDNGFVPKEGDPSLRMYLLKEEKLLSRGLTLELNGRLLRLEPISRNVIFPPGAGGLPTMKFGFVYRAMPGNLTPGSLAALHYRDANFSGRAGWKEIVATADSAIKLTASSAPATDRSAQLSNYPTDLLNSPPQDVEATLSFSAPFVVTENAAPKPPIAVAAVAAAGGNRIGGSQSAKADAPIAPLPAKQPQTPLPRQARRPRWARQYHCARIDKRRPATDSRNW